MTGIPLFDVLFGSLTIVNKNQVENKELGYISSNGSFLENIYYHPRQVFT
jgi:hypothetical protein